MRWTWSALLDAESLMHRIPIRRSISVRIAEIKRFSTTEKTDGKENEWIRTQSKFLKFHILRMCVAKTL